MVRYFKSSSMQYLKVTALRQNVLSDFSRIAQWKCAYPQFEIDNNCFYTALGLAVVSLLVP